MNQALYIFLFSGLVSMSAALSVGAINKMAEEDRPNWLQKRNNLVMMIMGGNVAALTLVGAMAFGFLTLHWSIPLSCMFITFPVAHQLLIARIFGPVKALFITLPLVILAAATLYPFWP